MTHRRPARSAAVLALALGLTAACSTSEPADETTSADDLAFAGESTAATADPDGDQLQEADSDDASAIPVFDGADGGATTPTTAGSGLPPVTVGAVPSGGDPQGIYRGVIGALGPDQIVTAGAAVAPAARADVQPLTGRPGRVATRPAAVVKIDNGSAASPQAGLNAADIVVEEEVEGGVTRFAAVFHSTPSIVGPVRSGRTTDVALLGGLGDPLLLYSGANDITQAILVDQPFIQNRGQGWSSGYWRDQNRRAPSNLFTDTAPHWASATGGPPPPQFHYRAPGAAVPGAAADEFTVAYPSSTARWEWDGERWLRWQRGDEHVLVNGEQVSAANVVVIEADEVDTGMVDASGGAVPEFVFVGSGRATVFTEGHRIEGTWTRPTLTSVATLTHGPGKPIELTPGRTWIQLVEAGSGTVR